MISRHQIVDLVELASANFDRLRVGTPSLLVHPRTSRADAVAALPTATRHCLRRASRPAWSTHCTPSIHGNTRRRACEHSHSFMASSDALSALADRELPLPREPTSVPSYQTDVADLPFQLHFDGISLPPQWYSRQHIFTFEKDAQVRLERSLGYLNEQRWCERLLDVRRKHGTKSNSSSRSSSPGARPSNRRPPGPGPGPNGLGSQPAVRSNPPSQTRTGYVTPPTQRARSHSMPAPPPRRPPIRRNTSSNLKTIYPPDQYIHVTEDPE